MKHDIRKHLHDAYTSVTSIFDFLKECIDFEDYMKNRMLRRAIERELEIIGEAINRALKQDPALSVEHARRIVDTRNYVIHSYDMVDHYIIWGILMNHLPKLKEELEALLKPD